jgi:hypothetical protein
MRPGIRLMSPFVWAFTAMSKMLADSIRPLAALMCPWNKVYPLYAIMSHTLHGHGPIMPV